MFIKNRGLNTNETYCCTKKDVKAVFCEENLNVYFGYSNIHSRNEVENSKSLNWWSDKSEPVVAMLSIYGRNHKFLSNHTSLSFFIIDKIGYNNYDF